MCLAAGKEHWSSCAANAAVVVIFGRDDRGRCLGMIWNGWYPYHAGWW